jgi:hypothetical protein
MHMAPLNSADAVPRRTVLLAGLALAAEGCSAPQIDDPRSWPQATMSDAEVKPNIGPNDASRRTRVVLLLPQESASARGHGLHEVATSTLETMLSAGGVELVDRRMATRLDQELRLVEMRGGAGSYGGPEIADYAITVTMGNATWNSTFQEAQQFKDKKGNITNVPASHTHGGRSQMGIRIYSLPALQLMHSIEVDGKWSTADQRSAATSSQAPGLMRGATEDGLKSKRADILNEFSPKGYVIDRRAKADKSIFRVMLGKQTGAKAGDTVEMISLTRVENPLTRRVSFDTIVVAEGKVSNIVGEGESWVIVDNAAKASRVRRGDIVRVRHSGASLLDRILQK